MCGVFGFVSNLNSGQKYILDPVGRWLSRRGPDGSGEFSCIVNDKKVILKHTRLAVIDLTDSGVQPMRSEDDRFCITYNGEIYNYIEIADELRGLGYQFKGTSDTEVLLAAWSAWGINALPKLNGMFAFAILDKVDESLWLVRDRFGVKPLYWVENPDESIVFSSSLALVAELSEAEIDLKYCARGLQYKVFETNDLTSPFSGVQQVSPGGWLRINLKAQGAKVTRAQWYDLSLAVATKRVLLSELSSEELLDQCKELLNDAVRLRMRADVPVAVSLSGGLDSTSIAAIAAEYNSDLHAFTYGSPNDKRSEGVVVKSFVEQLGINIEYVWPELSKQELGDSLETMFLHQEAPVSGLSVLAQNAVFGAVKSAGFKVVLGGQGGDEGFAGYRKFFLVAVREAFNNKSPFASFHFLWSLSRMLISEAEQGKLYWQNRGRYFGEKKLSFQLLNFESQSLNLMGASHTTLSERQIEDILIWSLPTLLRYEDRNSMGNSVESRLPFLDYRLIEFALALPAKLKIARGYGKWFLRDATKGLIPDHIRLNRMRRGFDIQADLIGNGVGQRLRDILMSSRSKVDGYLLPNVQLESLLSDEALRGNPGLLDEALMLTWLSQPLR